MSWLVLLAKSRSTQTKCKSYTSRITKIRLLTIVDHFTRESIAIDVGQRFRGKDVAETLERISVDRSLPKTIRVDNGPEFTSKALDKWAYDNKVILDCQFAG